MPGVARAVHEYRVLLQGLGFGVTSLWNSSPLEIWWLLHQPDTYMQASTHTHKIKINTPIFI